MRYFTALLALLAIVLFSGCGSDSKTQTQIMPIPITKTVTETETVYVEVMPDLPDLSVDMPYVCGDTLPGPNTFAIRVTNNGTDPSGPVVVHVKCFVTSSFDTTDVVSLLYEGDHGVLSTLAEGASTLLYFDATLPDAIQWIRFELTVDFLDSIPEILETNNEFNINVLIRAQGVST